MNKLIRTFSWAKLQRRLIGDPTKYRWCSCNNERSKLTRVLTILVVYTWGILIINWLHLSMLGIQYSLANFKIQRISHYKTYTGIIRSNTSYPSNEGDSKLFWAISWFNAQVLKKKSPIMQVHFYWSTQEYPLVISKRNKSYFTILQHPVPRLTRWTRYLGAHHASFKLGNSSRNYKRGDSWRRYLNLFVGLHTIRSPSVDYPPTVFKLQSYSWSRSRLFNSRTFDMEAFMGHRKLNLFESQSYFMKFMLVVDWLQQNIISTIIR